MIRRSPMKLDTEPMKLNAFARGENIEACEATKFSAEYRKAMQLRLPSEPSEVIELPLRLPRRAARAGHRRGLRCLGLGAGLDALLNTSGNNIRQLGDRYCTL